MKTTTAVLKSLQKPASCALVFVSVALGFLNSGAEKTLAAEDRNAKSASVSEFSQQGHKFLLPPPEFVPISPFQIKRSSGELSLGASAAPTTAPTNFLATGQNNQVTLSWDAVAGATGYNLWRSTGNGYSYLTATGNVNSYMDTSLVNGTRYDYAINAVNSSGSSPQFAYVSGTPYDPLAPYPYTAFDGYSLTRYLWPGEKVVVLTSSNTLNTSSMSKITAALDAGYLYYNVTTGRLPSLFRNINGKATIAEVPSTCGGGGAGCGYLGATGIEIQTTSFNALYNQVTNNDLYDQVPFYELGRNFWFYGDKIEYKGADNTGSVTTGYAVYMRFKAMEAANAPGAPFNGFSFNSFKSEIASLVDRYEANPTLNWSNTLKIGRAPGNSMNLGGTDLFASFCMRLERDYGGETFVQKLWKEVDKQPNAVTTVDALNNFVRAASIAANQDLTPLFQDRWRWPIVRRPTAVTDIVSLAEDGIASIRVLDNDWDAYGDPITITSVTQGTRGSVTIAASFAGVVYTPNTNVNGTDSFNYTISNGLGQTSTALVNVTVSPVNDAPTSSTQNVTTEEDIAKTITLSANDIDGDTLTYSIVALPTKGTLSGSGANRIYTPNADFNGADSFSFKASDETLDSDISVVSINVTTSNDAPTSSTQSVTTNEDSAKNITLSASDSDGDALTFSVVTQPANGVLSGSAPNLVYTPNANFNGTDSFSFKANDGTLDSNVATVNITVSPVNDAPISSTQSVVTNEDTAKNIALSASDVDGDALTYSVVTPPTKGALSGTAPSLVYTPNANFNGSDSFSFKANDGTLDSNASTVSITISPANDAPTSSGQSVTTAQNTAKSIALSASDIDGNALTYIIVSAPLKGVLSGSGANRVYTPNAGFSGSDSFTFKANDGALDSAISTVNINVTPVVPTSNCVITYKVTSQWSNGFNADVTIKNNGPTVNGWTLTWAFPNGQVVSNMWNAQSSQSGANVSAKDAGWNKKISTGGTVTFGFSASHNGTNGTPTSFKLNGQTCTIAP